MKKEQIPLYDHRMDMTETQELEKVRESALRILDRADNASGDLRRKLLKKGFNRNLVEEVIGRLVKADLLNDKRFAEYYSRDKAEAGKGPAWIRQKLLEKGISQKIADHVLAEVFEQNGERRKCLIKALESCGLKYDYEVDHEGNLQLLDDSDCEFGEKKVFERNVINEGNRVNTFREREKAKEKLARKLTASGFSQDSVLYAIRKISEL